MMTDATTDDSRLKLAVWQAASTPSDVDANLHALSEAAALAARGGAHLIMTPEMYITGYNIGDDVARLAAEQPLERVRQIARQHGIAILAGGPEQLDSGVANAAWLIDDGGEVLAKHRKLQLFGDLDGEQFIAGNDPFTIATYRGLTIAVLICFDVEYPEATRAAAQAGADLIAVPTANMKPYEFVNNHLIRVRAWENGVHVAYANQFGPDGEFDYLGLSVIADPLGRHLVQAGPEGESLITAMIDTATAVEARRNSPYLKEVRSELFTQGAGSSTRGE